MTTEATETTFLFQRPERVPGSTALNTIIQLGAIAGRTVDTRRTRVENKDGSLEDVGQHSFRLSIFAPDLLEVIFPDAPCSPDRIARLCSLHDMVTEAYVGDVPTDKISAEARLAKEKAEQLGFAQFKREYAHMPRIIADAEEYEEQNTFAARFVNQADKLAPLLTHIENDCSVLLRLGAKPEEVRAHAASEAERFRARGYSDMEPLIQLRLELAETVARRLEVKLREPGAA